MYLKMQFIPGLEPLKIHNNFHKLKTKRVFIKKCKKVQIDHVINHTFLANDKNKK